jgi:hypothetical protein
MENILTVLEVVSKMWITYVLIVAGIFTWYIERGEE